MLQLNLTDTKRRKERREEGEEDGSPTSTYVGQKKVFDG